MASRSFCALLCRSSAERPQFCSCQHRCRVLLGRRTNRQLCPWFCCCLAPACLNSAAIPGTHLWDDVLASSLIDHFTVAFNNAARLTIFRHTRVSRHKPALLHSWPTPAMYCYTIRRFCTARRHLAALCDARSISSFATASSSSSAARTRQPTFPSSVKCWCVLRHMRATTACNICGHSPAVLTYARSTGLTKRDTHFAISRTRHRSSPFGAQQTYTLVFVDSQRTFATARHCSVPHDEYWRDDAEKIQPYKNQS